MKTKVFNNEIAPKTKQRYSTCSDFHVEWANNQKIAQIANLSWNFPKTSFCNIIQTRRLANVLSHMMFRPAVIYIFELIVFWLTFLTKR